MKNLEKKVKKLLKGEEVDLYYKRFNDGTESEPDILIDRVYAQIENNGEVKDICVYLSKEDDEQIFDATEVYRIPYMKNKKILKEILKKAKKQAHYND
ncbi:MAG: hypothetical protein NUV46_04155 [Nanoarchaeota archaeon]|nr:hypothetical protein [Nanoarchaeota archaeon]